jgi:hypothetical protein
MSERIIDMAAARAQFQSQMAAKVREAQQEFHNDMVEMFRRHAVGLNLTGSQAASAAQLKADFPEAWAEALSRGLLGERRPVRPRR